eukprot:9007636-Pyramimonas_sp.AAC.1
MPWVIDSTGPDLPMAYCSSPTCAVARGVNTLITARSAMRRSAAVMTKGRMPPSLLRRMSKRPARAHRYTKSGACPLANWTAAMARCFA